MIVKPVGIENVVNWQDNGVFADTQKPVTDDNYTLAGDVNQDNLYVGYMKEHGLKGKLSLPVLSSLGAITGRQTIGDCEVYKHVNGTTIIKGAVINPNLPDSRISLGFSADENGLQYYNNPNDPMPIKTINMNGLQKWEETDDYIIYVDKDAMMTTVQQYVTGTYDLFLERKADVDGALELLRENGIEWTAEDDSKLLQDINLVQLEKIASMPTTMDEPTEIQTFETRTVPTTYECCFRTDKKTGEIYIGEGYENLAVVSVASAPGVTIDFETFHFPKGEYSYSNRLANIKEIIVPGETYSCKISLTFVSDIYDRKIRISTLGFETNKTQILNSGDNVFDFTGVSLNIIEQIRVESNTNIQEYDFWLKKHRATFTKTSTPKPFVKSVMPSGKLSFVTNATSETHSFLYKNLNSPTNGVLKLSTHSGLGETKESFNCSVAFSNNNVLISKRFVTSGVTVHDREFTDGIVNLVFAEKTRCIESLKQLLIYKGNLTEAELKAENQKVINVGTYYHQENSVPLIYGIDSMKSMRVYSPTLTDTEIAEEVNKNIYIPENRDGVPNYLGEGK